MSFIGLVSGSIALVLKGFLTWFEEIKLKEALLEKNHEMEMALVKSQLDPHFLFNTLNSITSLMDVDIMKAKTMTVDLADLLRHVLAHKDIQLIDLEEELDILFKYINIEKTRFSDELEISWQKEGDLQGIQIPSTLLQPLVEISIKHGFSRKHPSLKVDIKLSQVEDGLKIIIEDNGQGFSNDEAATILNQGTGIQNTKQTLQSIYGDKHAFEVQSKENGGVTNTIEIPIILKSEIQDTSEVEVKKILTS